MLSRKVIALGISQRTTPEAIETLAKNLFLDETGEVETVLALDIPRIRAFMHLDTVCTQLDRDKFLVHPGILGTLRVFEIRKGNGISGLTVRELNKDLKSILSEYTETDTNAEEATGSYLNGSSGTMAPILCACGPER